MASAASEKMRDTLNHSQRSALERVQQRGHHPGQVEAYSQMSKITGWWLHRTAGCVVTAIETIDLQRDKPKSHRPFNERVSMAKRRGKCKGNHFSAVNESLHSAATGAGRPSSCLVIQSSCIFRAVSCMSDSREANSGKTNAGDAAEAAKKTAEEEATKKADEEAKKKAEEEAQKKVAEEEAQKKAEADAANASSTSSSPQAPGVPAVTPVVSVVTADRNKSVGAVGASAAASATNSATASIPNDLVR